MYNDLQTTAKKMAATCFNQYTSAYCEIFNQYKYQEQQLFFDTEEGEIVSLATTQPFKMNFYGATTKTAVLTQLSTLPEFRLRGHATNTIAKFHRQLYQEGALLSFVTPHKEKDYHLFEKISMGGYWKSVFRATVALHPDREHSSNLDTEIIPADAITQEHFTFYKRCAEQTDFTLVPNIHDFLAEAHLHEQEGGKIFVTRRRGLIAGICLANQNTEGTVYARDIIVHNESVQKTMLDAVCTHYQTSTIEYKGACPGAIQQAEPFAMARVINVVKLFKTILHNHPGLELSIGVDGDLAIPENNGFYLLTKGELAIVQEVPEMIVTPGGLAAMFLGSYPTIMHNLMEPQTSLVSTSK